MRILWLGHNLAYPPKGGALQRNYNLLHQAAKKCEVHMLSFDQPVVRPIDVTPQDCVRALKSFCASVDWVPLSQEVFREKNRYWLALRGLVSSDPFEVHWLQSWEMAEKFKKIVERIDFDIIHFDTLGLAQYRHLVRGSGTVLNHHDVQSSLMDRRATNEPNVLLNWYWQRESRKLRETERKLCPQFGLNLVVSKGEEELLLQSASNIETRIVPNGVDTDYFTPRSDPGGRTLLFCGSLDTHPNRAAMSYFFAEIWPKLISRVENVEMYVIGRIPPNWLKQLSAKDPRVHVLGFVEDVRPYFKKATALVCPIRDGGGTRIKILDSLAMGVPVISTSFAASGLCLEHGKHILMADTPVDFVYQIEEMLSNAKLRASLATAGVEVVSREYSWEVIGRSLIEAYEAASCGQNLGRA